MRALSQLTACLRGRIPPNVDWPAILSLANDALITPELFTLVESEPASQRRLPDDVSTFLAEVHRRNNARNANLFGTLKDALAAMNAVGIEPVLMKGCAMWVHGDSLNGPPHTSRMSSDLDLLVSSPIFETAINALRNAGWEVLEDNRDQTYHPVVVLGRPIDAGSIDLHQSLPSLRGIEEMGDLAGASRTIMCADYRAKVPSPEVQILIGILHDQLLDGHFWRGGFELRHLLDISALSRRTPGVDWDSLQELCSVAGVRSAMSAQLRAAKLIADADVPDEIICGFWGRFHYWRQRLQFTHPALNRPFHAMGLNKNVWRALSSRNLRKAEAQ